MGQETEVVELYAIDHRIALTFSQQVPSPKLAEYLENALREHKGTLIVARLIVGALVPFFEKHQARIEPEAVSRLGVHDFGEDVIERVSMALKQIEPTYLAQARNLLASFEYQEIRPVDGTPRQEGKRCEVRVIARAGMSQDHEVWQIYARIFICALAMWSGVKIDPREPNQATRIAAGG